MKKEIKNFEKIMGIMLIVLTIISLIINALEYTNMIYSNSYNTNNLNGLLVSKSFNILLWLDNILIYICSIFYIVITVQSKRDILIKVSFSLFSILTTIFMSNLIINGIAVLFGIF